MGVAGGGTAGLLLRSSAAHAGAADPAAHDFPTASPARMLSLLAGPYPLHPAPHAPCTAPPQVFHGVAVRTMRRPERYQSDGRPAWS